MANTQDRGKRDGKKDNKSHGAQGRKGAKPGGAKPARGEQSAQGAGRAKQSRSDKR